MEQSLTPRQEVEQNVVWKAWNDAEFLSRLRQDPAAALAEVTDIAIPEGVTIEVIEETPDRMVIVIPSNRTDIAVEDLDQMAGAAGCCSYTSSCC